MGKIYGVDVGDWYQTSDGRVFRIVSIDCDDETIEVQYVDGDLEEIEFDYWCDIEPASLDGPPGRSGMSYDVFVEREYEPDSSTLSDVLGRIEYNH